MEQGYRFEWPPFQAPFMVTPGGKRVPLVVDNFVPYLASGTKAAPVAVGGDVGDAICVAGSHRHAVLRAMSHPGVAICDAGRPSSTISAAGAGAARLGEANIAIRDAGLPPGGTRDAAPSLPAAADPPVGDDGPRDLKSEALGLAHLMTHLPKNRWCTACQRAKMQRKACMGGWSRRGCHPCRFWRCRHRRSLDRQKRGLARPHWRTGCPGR